MDKDLNDLLSKPDSKPVPLGENQVYGENGEVIQLQPKKRKRVIRVVYKEKK